MNKLKVYKFIVNKKKKMTPSLDTVCRVGGVTPSLNAIRAIPSAYHMVIKFPTANGVGMVREDQRIASECYSASMKQKAVDNIYMDELDMIDEMSTRPIPSEELESIHLDEQPKHLIYIGSKLAKDVKDLLIHFLKQNMEVFA